MKRHLPVLGLLLSVGSVVVPSFGFCQYPTAGHRSWTPGQKLVTRLSPLYSATWRTTSQGQAFRKRKPNKDQVWKGMPYITTVLSKSHKINPCSCIITDKIEIEDASPSCHCVRIEMKSQTPLTVWVSSNHENCGSL